MKRALVMVAMACFTFQDVRNEGCRVYCITKGYDRGFYQDDQCFCADARPYDKVLEKKLVLPRRPHVPVKEETPSFGPWTKYDLNN